MSQTRLQFDVPPPAPRGDAPVSETAPIPHTGAPDSTLPASTFPLIHPWNVAVPVNNDDTPHDVRRLYALVTKAYDASHDSHTFDDLLGLWDASLRHFEGGEADYMAIAKRVHPDVVKYGAQALGVLMEHFWIDGCYSDLLGPVYMEIRSNWGRNSLGQYFTPWTICRAMAQMSIHDDGDLRDKLERGERVTACDPAIGSGATMLAFRGAVAEKYGRRAADRLVLYGQDIDMTCVRMAKIQIKLSNGFWMTNFQLATMGPK